MPPAADAFALLSEPMRSFLSAEGFTKPTVAQERAVPVILAGGHTLLIAPTGMGKTESAVIPVFDQLVRLKRREAAAAVTRSEEESRRAAAGLPPTPDPQAGIRVLYVTPLRALNRDMMGRLERWGAALGFTVSVRHGDTTNRERQKQARDPPDVLITTPETLQAMLTGSRLRVALAGVRWVVVDEVHELAEDERGAQLAFALERVEELVEDAGGGPFQRVGLSATVGDPDEVAQFLGGGRDVRVVKVSVARNLDLRVASPKPGPRDVRVAEKLMCKADAAAFLNLSLDLVRDHTSTLLFVNTRETAEVLSARVRMLDAEYPLRIHHGSLSKDVRIDAEEDFKQGRARALVCTSSMELGIDIGSADLVIQYGSPRQVTRLVQRVGRAGHRHDLVSNGVIIAQDPDDILESAVIVSRTLAEELEVHRHPRLPLDVLANQLAAMAVQKRSLRAHDAFEMARRTLAFRDLEWDTFERTLKQLEDLWLLWRDDGDYGGKRRSRLYLYDNLSMIPDARTFRVVNMVTRRTIATLDEGFVASFAEPGAAFICQGQPWRVVEIRDEKDEVHVEPVKDPLGAIPSWIGEEIPVPFEVAQGVGALRARIRDVTAEGGPDAARALIADAYHLDADAAARALAYVDEQREYALPTDRVITLDYAPGSCIINACLGTQVNETLGRLLAALLMAKLGESVGLQIDPYRIMLSLPPRARSSHVKETLLAIEPATVEPLLRRLLVNSSYLRHRLLHVARKFGAVGQRVDHSRVNVGRLLDLYKDTPLFEEAVREVFHDKLDVARTAETLVKLREGSLELVEQGLSPVGAAGLDQRVELISPTRADHALLLALKNRLLDERVVLACLNCRDWTSRTRVKRGAKTRQCPKCGGVIIGVYRPWNDVAKKAWEKKGRLTPEENKELARLRASANIFFDHGEKGLIALASRGIGPETAGRVLAKQRDDEDAFLRDLLEAEVSYAKTRQFWD